MIWAPFDKAKCLAEAYDFRPPWTPRVRINKKNKKTTNRTTTWSARGGADAPRPKRGEADAPRRSVAETDAPGPKRGGADAPRLSAGMCVCVQYV